MAFSSIVGAVHILGSTDAGPRICPSLSHLFRRKSALSLPLDQTVYVLTFLDRLFSITLLSIAIYSMDFSPRKVMET